MRGGVDQEIIQRFSGTAFYSTVEGTIYITKKQFPHLRIFQQ